jgi:thioredoxin-dependent peroxiredoxin
MIYVAMPTLAQQITKPGPSVKFSENLSSDVLSPMLGKLAPSFRLPDQDAKPVSLASARGKWLVLAFYPADMTSGCTLQNKSYSESKDAFISLNALCWTVSTQDVKSKRIFCLRDKLTGTLLSDVGGKVSVAYGVFDKERGLAKRITFYIAPDGNIAFIDSKINVKSAATDSLAILNRLVESKAR